MILTPDNYYSVEANREYMSCSQYQSFMDCEARTMAELEGRYVREDSDAFLVGNYVHTYLEGPEAHKEFVDHHFGSIYKTAVDKKTGEIVSKGKYAPFVKADEMINTILDDKFLRSIVEADGEREKIVTGDLFGAKWKAAFDKYFDRTIFDYKTCENLRDDKILWKYGYYMRAAVYTALEMQLSRSEDIAPFIILFVTKESPPYVAAGLMDDPEEYSRQLSMIEENLPHIIDVKSGKVPPTRCERCAYCRSTHKVMEIVPVQRLFGGNEK